MIESKQKRRRFTLYRIFFLFIFSSVTFCGVCAYAMGDMPKNDKPLTEPQKEFYRLQELQKGGKCPEKTIIVEIDGIQLRVPRDMTVTFEDGSKIKGMGELQYRCDLTHLKNVANVVSPTGSLGISKFQYSVGKYEKVLSDNGVNISTEKVQTLVQGIKKLDPDKYLYELPQETSPTGNDKPVLVSCFHSPEKNLKEGATSKPRAQCSATYVHPVGLQVGYRFFSNIDDFIQRDKNIREKIKSYFVSKSREIKE